MELLSALLALISIHAVFVATEFEFVKAAHSEVLRTNDCTEALGWHLVISRIFLWPLLWLVNQLKRYTVHLA